VSATAIACVHEEVLDYPGGRYLGYCRKCGRTMEYDPAGHEKPRDVTAEFDGTNPFPSPFESGHSTPITPHGQDKSTRALSRDKGDNYTLTSARSRLARERQQQAKAPEEPTLAGTGGGSNNRERARYYLAHKEEILADVRELGPTKARRKWGIPSSTFNHHMRAWGVDVPHRVGGSRRPGASEHYASNRESISQDIIIMAPKDVCAKWGIPKGSYGGLVERWGLREQRDEALGSGHIAKEPAPAHEEQSQLSIQLPAGAADKRDNIAKSRRWKEHFDEIAEDMRTLGREATQAKWGMGETWFYAHGLSGKAARAQTPEAFRTTAGNGHDLPPWSDAWDPIVQVAWLRACVAMAAIDELKIEAPHA